MGWYKGVVPKTWSMNVYEYMSSYFKMWNLGSITNIKEERERDRNLRLLWPQDHITKSKWK